MLTLRPQEIPFDHPDSCHFFTVDPGMPLIITSAALAQFTFNGIVACLKELQGLAKRHRGLAYVQMFEDPEKPEPLWLIEDRHNNRIAALLPSEFAEAAAQLGVDLPA